MAKGIKRDPYWRKHVSEGRQVEHPMARSKNTAASPAAADDTKRPHITLVQFLKTIDVVSTGGAGKHRVRAGGILVNGTEELRPARKLHTGDEVTVDGQKHTVAI